MTTDIDWALLDRYFAGGCTPEEAAAVQRWAERDPRNADTLAAARTIWEKAGALPRRFDAHAALRTMRARLGHASAQASAPALRLHPLAPPREERRARWWAIAAAAVVAALGGTVFVRAVPRPPEAPAQAEMPAHEYATTTGQRADILLPDGTRVSLNVASELRVPASYGVGARDVYLSGEAFFDVRHDARHPFRVHTPGAIAEDLGTAFVVRAYAADSASTVVVASGRVAVRGRATDARQRAALGRGQLGRVDAAGRVSVVPAVNVADYTAWRAGRLIFRQTPLADVARELERWYGVRVTVADSALAATPVTGTFVDQPLDAVLTVVARSLDVRYSRQATHVRFSLKPARH
ncbi:MAG: FecR domain-containing protein [Gemmatimonadaceae bacterium]|nr:FecR domain-containing protein [Gemmatimonadaceae bacterium]